MIKARIGDMYSRLAAVLPMEDPNSNTPQSLTVLDFLIHAGSENVVLYFRDNPYIIKPLKKFIYMDEDGKDHGANVRQKAKDISNLLSDPARLQEERRARAGMIWGDNSEQGEDEEDRGRRSYTPPGALPRKNRGADLDEKELRKAIEESKKSLAEEQSRITEENDLAAPQFTSFNPIQQQAPQEAMQVC
jgi:epsin